MLRILSDMHLYDARTQVKDLRQLEPLFIGVRTLALNGDSCEMRRDVTAAQVEALREFFRARVPEVVFLTGNHDPDISDNHEFLAADGRVWVTHGDICLDGLTPWSRHAAHIRELLARHLAQDPRADYAELATRFRIARAVAREEEHVPDLVSGGWLAHAKWMWRTFFPPRQVVAMLRAWRELPVSAAALAQAQRPTVQVVVTGHVHLPRVWVHAGRPVVINTGSFLRPLGGHLVDVVGDRVVVRRIVRERGAFVAGRTIAEITLRPV